MVWFVLLFSFIKIKPCFLRSSSITFNFNWKKDKEHNIIFFFISFLLLFLTCFQLNYKVTREFNWNKRENEAKGMNELCELCVLFGLISRFITIPL